MRTNDACEESFNVQKQRIYGRVAKKQVVHMVETQGEAYLLVTHCTEEELSEDILAGVTTRLIKRLEAAQQGRIVAKTQDWNWGDRDLGGYCGYLLNSYPGWEDIKEEETL